MSTVKYRVKTCFNKASASYDQHCTIQEKIAKQLLEYLPKLQYNIIADMASGTGISTSLIAQKFQPSKLYAIDFSENLLAKVTEKVPSAEVICSDFDERLALKNLDLLVCSMGLQWSPYLEKTLNLFFSYLSPGALLAVAIPLSNTFYEFNIKYRNAFPQCRQVIELLKVCGELTCYKQTHYTKAYDDALSALRSIKAVGANCHLANNMHKGLSTRGIIDRVFLNEIKLTYDIGFFIVRKFS